MRSVYSPNKHEPQFLIDVMKIQGKTTTQEIVRDFKPVAGGIQDGYLVYGASFSPHLLLRERANGLVEKFETLIKEKQEEIKITVVDNGIGREVINVY